MFRSIILSAAAAGLAVGLLTTAIQAVTTTPLILKAEVYEKQESAAPVATAHVHGTASPTAPATSTQSSTAASERSVHEHDEDEGWAPADGLERTLYTALANILVAVAISAMLLGLMVLRGDPVNAQRGLLWGIAGFVAASMLPSMGLPPELPGTEAADIISRQTWWLYTMVASGAGLALIALAKQRFLKVGGVVLLVLPQIIGAPAPPTLIAAYPAGLASEFVSLSLAVSAFIWALSGLAAGWLFTHVSESKPGNESGSSEQVA